MPCCAVSSERGGRQRGVRDSGRQGAADPARPKARPAKQRLMSATPTPSWPSRPHPRPQPTSRSGAARHGAMAGVRGLVGGLDPASWGEVVLAAGRPEDDRPGGCGGRRARPGGRHCEQRLGKGPVRPPGPATSQDAHRRRHSTPRDLPGILDAPSPPSPGDGATSGLGFPGRPGRGQGQRSLPVAPAGCGAARR